MFAPNQSSYLHFSFTQSFFVFSWIKNELRGRAIQKMIERKITPTTFSRVYLPSTRREAKAVVRVELRDNERESCFISPICGSFIQGSQ